MPTHLRFPTRILVFALLLGLTADQLFVGRWLGLSALVFVAAGLVALAISSVAERRPPTWANMWLGFAALLFAGLLALRDAPLLIALNAAATFGLLLLLVANFRAATLHRRPSDHVLTGSIAAVFMAMAAPFVLLRRSIRAIPAGRTNVGRMLPVARGVLLAVPALFVFGGLLMAADSVFASYVVQTLSLAVPINLEWLIQHGFVVGVVAWGCAGGIAVALSAEVPNALPAEGDTQRLASQQVSWRFLGWVEAITVLVAVDLLFGAFMLVQGAYFFGGLDTLARTQMTYADYARRGFFELVAVACMALALLWLLALIGKREPGQQCGAFNAASVAMVVLVLGMLVSAFQRMWLYEEAYGFTQLRIYTHSFMLWLAAILLLFVLALLRDMPRYFTFGGCVATLAYLLALNVANPDALIVRANIARYAETGVLDSYYLAELSADATPDLVAALNRVDDESRTIIAEALALREATLQNAMEQYGWPAWSVARSQALNATTSNEVVQAASHGTRLDK